MQANGSGSSLTLKRREVTEVGGRIAAPGKLAEGQRKLRARLIAGDVQGSSGYYPESVIERDGPRAFPKGTHMHLDHQSFMEMWTKPEGSIKDLAAVIYSDPVYERNNPQGKGLYADILLFSEYADMLIEMAPYIGLSIVAVATSDEAPNPETGELTDIISEIIAGVRVDFVTFPGADGRITEIIESHKPSVPDVPGSKEIRETTPLTGESAGSKKKGAVKQVEITDEMWSKLQTSIESTNTNITALTSVLTTEAQARQAREAAAADGEKPKLPDVIRAAVKGLAESGLPLPSQDRVIDQVTSGAKPLSEAIAAEKAYLESLGVRFNGASGNGSGASQNNTGGGGGFVADRSGGAGGDDLDLSSQWWASEAMRDTAHRPADSVVIESSKLLAAFGG